MVTEVSGSQYADHASINLRRFSEQGWGVVKSLLNYRSGPVVLIRMQKV
jgi:hypothetical protein